MHQLRWHALLQEWVAFSTDRQNRPQMPVGWCPFCPGSGRVPDEYDVYLYPNDYPAFAPDSDPFRPYADLFAQTGAQGRCDVLLYSPEHTLPPSRLSVESWRKVVEAWTTRTAEFAEDAGIEFVAIFENCGEAVGVTMPHPHGQIYAMPMIPSTVEREIRSAAEFAAENEGKCLFCALLQREVDDGTRLVAANDHFLAFVPFAARFPGEISIFPRRHVRTLPQLDEAERAALASLIGIVRQKYDNLYGFVLPLMMAVAQAPLRQTGPPYHLHTKLWPLQRSRTKLKFVATIELAFGIFLADTSPEQVAEELRRSFPAA